MTALALGLAILPEANFPRSHGQTDLLAGDQDYPVSSVEQLLAYGLAAEGGPTVAECKDLAHELVSGGEDAVRVDLAVGLIFARLKQFEEMRRVLEKSDAPDDLQLLRLRSWAQLSDRQYEQGLKTAVAMLEALGRSSAAPEETDRVVRHAGAAFGFAAVAISAVKPGLLERVDDLHEAALAAVPESHAAVFQAAETHMHDTVSAAIAGIKQEQTDESEQVATEKQQTAAALEEQQRLVEGEASQRQQQAAMIQQQATQSLMQLQQRAAPYQQELGRLNQQLGDLRSIRDSKKEDFEKKAYDPQIDALEAEIRAVQSQLSPLVAEYNQIEGNAVMALNQLGARFNHLGRMHQANRTRLRRNEKRSETGVNARVATALRLAARLATHAPLDLAAEERLLTDEAKR